MLKSIALQNYKSFGAMQTVPLEPITVLVGPNNSGKSNFVGVGTLIKNAIVAGGAEALKLEGGPDSLVHRPARDSGATVIEWRNEAGEPYRSALRRVGDRLSQTEEILQFKPDGTHWHDAWTWEPGTRGEKTLLVNPAFGEPHDPRAALYEPFSALHHVVHNYSMEMAPFDRVLPPMIGARSIRLSLEALRQPAQVVPDPVLLRDGSGLAAVLGLWKGMMPERGREFDDFIGRCLPEVEHVLVKPAEKPGHQSLWIQQRNGERFDVRHASDGVLFFLGLATHILDTLPGSVLFIEEPEIGIHPSRLAEVVELMRRTVDARRCQFVISTHAPLLLNSFRDEPEAIVCFSRQHDSTIVRRVSDDPALVETLHDLDPGTLHASGFFNYSPA